MTTKTDGAGGVVRRTLEDWEAVPNTNPLCDDIDDAARKLGYVFDKTKTAETAAILCGQPGMGKSEAIRQALGATGLKGLFFKHGDQRQRLDAFELAHRTRQPLILEEADNVLKSEGQANILKEAMDQAGNRIWTGAHDELGMDERAFAILRIMEPHATDAEHTTLQGVAVEVGHLYAGAQSSQPSWFFMDGYKKELRREVRKLLRPLELDDANAVRDEIEDYAVHAYAEGH